MKIFLACVDNNEILKHHPSYVLRAYEYNMKPDTSFDINQYVEDFLLDSGAFTVINAVKKGKGSKFKNIDWYDYAVKYADYVKAINAKHYFELDIDCMVGYEEVLKLRKIIEDRVGWRSIPVWHTNRGLADFSKMCKDYKYVAIGINGQIPKSKQFTLKYFIDEAHRHGAKIHGLGFTQTAKLPLYNFDTVDSTTWLNGAKFYKMTRFNGHKIVDFRDATMKAKVGYETLRTQTLVEWIKYQQYAKDNL